MVAVRPISTSYLMVQRKWGVFSCSLQIQASCKYIAAIINWEFRSDNSWGFEQNTNRSQYHVLQWHHKYWPTAPHASSKKLIIERYTRPLKLPNAKLVKLMPPNNLANSQDFTQIVLHRKHIDIVCINKFKEQSRNNPSVVTSCNSNWRQRHLGSVILIKNSYFNRELFSYKAKRTNWKGEHLQWKDSRTIKAIDHVKLFKSFG